MRGARGSTNFLVVFLIAMMLTLQGCPGFIGSIVGASESIQEAINQADPGDTIEIMGTHHEDIVIETNGLMLMGQNGATIDGKVIVKADNVTLQTLSITGKLDTPTGSFSDLELDNVILYGKTVNTTISCTAVVNPSENLQAVVDALSDGDTVCLAPAVSIDGLQTNNSLTFIRFGSGEIVPGGVNIAKQDFTGDGTDDIRLENEQIFVQLNGEDLNEGFRKPMLSRGGLRESGDLTGSDLQAGPDVTGKVTTNPVSDIQDNGNLSAEFRSTEIFEIVTDQPNSGAFQIRRNYYTFGATSDDRIPMEIDVTVSLAESDNFVILDITFRNEGTESFTFDEDPGHIHDGTKLLTKNALAGRDQSQDDYRFFLPGQHVRYIKDQPQWRTYTATEWVTMFDAEDAATYGVIEGPTPPRMWIIGGDGRLNYFREELTLDPGESATYTAVVGIHEGGSDAPTAGAQIIQEASGR